MREQVRKVTDISSQNDYLGEMALSVGDRKLPPLSAANEDKPKSIEGRDERNTLNQSMHARTADTLAAGHSKDEAKTPERTAVEPTAAKRSAPVRGLIAVTDFIFKKEIILGPSEIKKPEHEGSSSEPTTDRSLWRTGWESFGLLAKCCPSVLGARLGLALVNSSLPLLVAYGTSRTIGAITDLGTTSTTILGGLLVVGGITFLSDIVSRVSGLVESWQWRKRDRVLYALQSRITRSWSYEDLEDNKKQLSVTRFQQHGTRIIDLMDNIFTSSGAALSVAAATVFTWSVDWRLSVIAVAFIAVRTWRDLKEAKTSHKITKANAMERRRISVVAPLGACPKASRDPRQLGKDGTLAADRNNRMAEIDKQELKNDSRVQSIRLGMDVIPALLAVTGVAILAQMYTTGLLIPIKPGMPNPPLMTPEKMIAFLGYLTALLSQCRVLGFGLGKVAENRTFASETLDFVASKRTAPKDELQIPYRTEPPTISLKGVTVVRSERSILDIPALTIFPGEIVGIIGQEGSGKSTLMKVILGMREPSTGSVTLGWEENAYDLQNVKVSSWHEMVGNYSQDFDPPMGFTVKRMLELGKSNDKDRLDMSEEEVLAFCHASDLVAKNKKGLESVIGAGWDDGIDFSGGQRKLLGLTQAVRRKSPVIILDEPSANISKSTAKLVIEEICGRARENNQTVLIVTHNIENLSYVDRIIGIKDGKIDQDGTPAKLLKEAGLYRNGLLDHSKQALELIGYTLVPDPNDPENFRMVKADPKANPESEPK
jgi:ABC-type multidrug transport system fused ATPase/permease subunit